MRTNIRQWLVPNHSQLPVAVLQLLPVSSSHWGSTKGRSCCCTKRLDCKQRAGDTVQAADKLESICSPRNVVLKKKHPGIWAHTLYFPNWVVLPICLLVNISLPAMNQLVNLVLVTVTSSIGYWPSSPSSTSHSPRRFANATIWILPSHGTRKGEGQVEQTRRLAALWKVGWVGSLVGFEVWSLKLGLEGWFGAWFGSLVGLIGWLQLTAARSVHQLITGPRLYADPKSWESEDKAPLGRLVPLGLIYGEGMVRQCLDAKICWVDGWW